MFQKYRLVSIPIVGIPNNAILSAMFCSNPYHPPSPEKKRATGPSVISVFSFVRIKGILLNLVPWALIACDVLYLVISLLKASFHWVLNYDILEKSRPVDCSRISSASDVFLTNETTEFESHIVSFLP